jgi:hypothetical protein
VRGINRYYQGIFLKNPRTTGLFDKVVEIRFHPGNIGIIAASLNE